MCSSDLPHEHALINGLVRLELGLGPAAQAELFLVAHRRAADLPKTRLVVDALIATIQGIQSHHAC